ncbi:MAG: phosphoribosyltransferase family protein [Eubacteriales bacterium]|nr:adenine phosphoribosyltransferase [Clostridiales bacterium]MDD6342199.1 phosphoribosyltransferase family protein [Eubacteriales bacterium]MDY3760285.1 phosphoribosyltransferase family protein [Eubacteriales bacterium]
MQKTYKMNIAGLERELPLCPVSDNLDIAAFIIFGDVELTVKCAEALIPLLPEHDIMLTAEAKSIPLIHELAKQQGENEYIIARKGEKVYMPSPISVNVRSITTQRVQTLYLGADDAEKMNGKRVLIIDDVISTGESLKALEALVSKAGGKTVGRAAVLAEGDAADRNDIIFLEKLPVFPK